MIVVSWNTRDLLVRCLESVLSTAPPHLSTEIVVVDNASEDGTAEMIQDRFPQVRLLRNGTNRGFAAASNQGLEAARGQLLFLLNPDTELREGALDRLTEAVRPPEAGLVGPRLLFPDGRLQHSAFRFPDLWQVFLDLFPLHPRLLESGLNGRYPRRLYEGGEPFRIDHPLGAAMMTDRSVVEAVGALDQGFFMYCEEIDWSLRIRRAGYQVLCHPGAEVVHHLAQATAQSPGEMFVALHRSRFRLYRKHYSRTFQRMARLIVAAGMRWSLFRTWRAVRAGKLVPAEGGDRVRTYREVLALPAASES